MRLGVYELFREHDERDFLHIDYEAEVQAFEDKNESIPQPAGHGLITDKPPPHGEPALPVVLQRGARAEVPLKEGLQGQAEMLLGREHALQAVLLGAACSHSWEIMSSQQTRTAPQITPNSIRPAQRSPCWGGEAPPRPHSPTRGCQWW